MVSMAAEEVDRRGGCALCVPCGKDFHSFAVLGQMAYSSFMCEGTTSSSSSPARKRTGKEDGRVLMRSSDGQTWWRRNMNGARKGMMTGTSFG